MKKLAAPAAAVLLSLSLAACGDEAASDDTASGDGGSSAAAWEPVTITHAYGETVIEEKPERVATIDFANQEVPLALGVVPVGMSEMTWGDDDGDGVQPWTEEKLEELGAETPVLFDETDGYDFEAIAGTEPDVILAGYSGMTEDDYDTLSEIAPVVAFPDDPWATEWRDSLMQNARGLGMEEEGEQLVADVEQSIEDAVAAHPELEGATGMFLTHVDPADLSEVNFYSAADTRSKYLTDLGMEIAPSVVEATGDSGDYAGSISAERADELADADVIITYGGDELIDALEGDPVLSQLPAVKNKAIVNLDGTKPIGTGANPTPLSVPYLVEEYVGLLAEAAAYTTE
ncbi:iron-siderophore ABC transporter substrate-binding protein [Nocardioides sp. S-58]|uniref:Iron-siderophore ABC transporter substrate-binding protein n=1 Tax=Nocardioides renjunii TaxID=3095075 RepID=A0ABU5K5Z3_9ACTN|nr:MULTISPECIES: iron-siderophore ABC transporter substrate-binding protein [unclassified Nocardioides]MDZ5660387.1 iron-siderophore ABC transporter substrate-binding protein [Nocardioides sp. S-58]